MSEKRETNMEILRGTLNDTPNPLNRKFSKILKGIAINDTLSELPDGDDKNAAIAKNKANIEKASYKVGEIMISAYSLQEDVRNLHLSTISSMKELITLLSDPSKNKEIIMNSVLQMKAKCRRLEDNRRFINGICGNITCENITFKKCTCKNIYYCCKRCQIGDWSNHKIKCSFYLKKND